MSKVFKSNNKKPKGRGSNSSTIGSSVGSQNESSNSSQLVDPKLFEIACSNIGNEKVIGTVELKEILNVIKQQEDVILTRPRIATSELQKFLNYHLNLLELFPKNREGKLSSNTGGNEARYKLSGSNDLDAIPYKLSLHSDELNFLKISCLDLLTNLIKHAKKSRTFSFWYAFLPEANSNPFKLGIFDLLDHINEGVKLAALSLVQTFFHNSSTYLLLANYHCRSSSFTPVCYEFAVCLGKLVLSVTSKFQYGSPTIATAVAKTLVTILEQVPFHRLQNGILTSISDKLLRLKLDANPVIQIAVLQVCSALIGIEQSQTVSQEIKTVFQDFFKMFLIRSFPNQVNTSSNISSAPSFSSLNPIDNNIRYVSIQCLGKLAQLDISLFLQNVDTALMKVFEEVLKTEKDTSLCLHLLRLIKGIGTCGPKWKSDTSSQQTWVVEKMVHFWSSFFIRPLIFDYIERRGEAILQAALCDCLSEVGELVFSLLPTDRRMLCVTYLLRKSYLEEGTDNRVVTTSQVRGIGMLVSWPSCYSDSAILIDSAEILLDVLGRQEDSNIHKNVALSGSWALANLVDALARLSKSYGGTNMSCKTELEEIPSLNGDLEFPPHLTLQLAKVAIRYASNIHNLMNIRANCCRCLGGLIRCLDGMVIDQADPDAIIHDVEFNTVTVDIIDAIILNISTGKAMKVRWNACYAAGAVFNPSYIFEDKKLASKRLQVVESLLPIVENFPNFKVRISAAFALACAESKQIFGDNFQEIILTVVRALDTVHDISEEDEAQHRSDLIDQLCLTFCHLLSLADSKDLDRLNVTLVDNYSTDTLESSLRTVAIRISPEKASTIISVKRQIQENWTPKQKRSEYLESSNCILSIFSNIDIMDSHCF